MRPAAHAAHDPHHARPHARARGARRLAAACCALALGVAALAAPLRAQAESADEVYAVLAVDELVYPDGPGDPPPSRWSTWRTSEHGRARLEAPAEGFLVGFQRATTFAAAPVVDTGEPATPTPREGLWIAVRAPAAATARGQLTLAPFSFSRELEAQRVAFEIPAEAFDAAHRAAYLELRAAHDEQLVERGVAGAAYFRHRQLAALAELGRDAPPEPTPDDLRARRDSVADTFELFSGARAISENLALDRRLPASDPAAESVPLSSIQGVEVPPYEWGELLDGLSPEPDPLATLIPDDQYGLFFPSFHEMMNVVDHAMEFGAPVMDTFEPRAVDARTLERLEAQLALPRSVLARTVGPLVIRSVAVTGAGYELRTGTDVALLFEAVDVDVLHKTLQTRTRAAAGGVEGAGINAGDIRGVEWELLSTTDRRLSCYLAKVGPAVVVTNSLPQLRRIVATYEGRKANLTSSPEYTFFRDRYPRGAEGESAFALLSDATIRRWCGPRWRIASSRLARGRAALLELQSRRLDELEAGVLVGNVRTPADLADLGRVRAEASLLHSDRWGTRDFSTPVLEVTIEAATEAEAALYERWRADYERNWREVFDPIAVSISLREGRLAADVSVRPLQVNSDYETQLEPVRGGHLAPTAADPHADALIHHALAVDPESSMLRNTSVLAMSRALSPDLDPLRWLGGAVAIWADQDPFWDEFAAADETSDFVLAELHRLPVALHADVRSGFALAAFLTAARATIEGSAPGMLAWETREHLELPYVRVGPTSLAISEMGIPNDEGMPDPEQLALYYVASAEGLTLSLNEDVVRRALERQQARRDAVSAAADASDDASDDASADADADANDDAVAPVTPWLGEHLALRVDLRQAPALYAMDLDILGQHSALQRLSWDNLPILDAWRARFPDEDPVALHRRLWGEDLVCPGGGSYRFNAQDGVMESSAYGHPGRPLRGPELAPVVRSVRAADFGLTFEDDGLRARAVVEIER